MLFLRETPPKCSSLGEDFVEVFSLRGDVRGMFFFLEKIFCPRGGVNFDLGLWLLELSWLKWSWWMLDGFRRSTREGVHVRGVVLIVGSSFLLEVVLLMYESSFKDK